MEVGGRRFQSLREMGLEQNGPRDVKLLLPRWKNREQVLRWGMQAASRKWKKQGNTLLELPGVT